MRIHLRNAIEDIRPTLARNHVKPLNVKYVYPPEAGFPVQYTKNERDDHNHCKPVAETAATDFDSLSQCPHH